MPLEPGEAAALTAWASRGGGVLLRGLRIPGLAYYEGDEQRPITGENDLGEHRLVLELYAQPVPMADLCRRLLAVRGVPRSAQAVRQYAGRLGLRRSCWVRPCGLQYRRAAHA